MQQKKKIAINLNRISYSFGKKNEIVEKLSNFEWVIGILLVSKNCHTLMESQFIEVGEKWYSCIS